VDGNKRAALACALVFLEMNGAVLLDPRRILEGAVLRVASGKMDKEELAELLRRLSTRPRGR